MGQYPGETVGKGWSRLTGEQSWKKEESNIRKGGRKRLIAPKPESGEFPVRISAA